MQSAGLWIGAMAMDAKRAQTFVTVFILSQFLVAGFFVRSIPKWIDWAKYLSFMYWGYSAVTKTQLGSVDVKGCNPDDLEARCTLSELRTELRTPRALDETRAIDICIIIGFFLTFRILAYVVLQRRTRS